MLLFSETDPLKSVKNGATAPADLQSAGLRFSFILSYFKIFNSHFPWQEDETLQWQSEDIEIGPF